VSSQNSAVKRWAQFVHVVLGGDSVVLFDVSGGLPSAADVREAEAKVLLFAQWLRLSLTPASVRQYLSSLWAQHQSWMGGRSLADLGVDFSALRMVLRIMLKQSPPRKHVKAPFSAALLARLLPFSWSSRGSLSACYFRTAGYAAAAMALEQMMRLSEIVRTAKCARANLNPISVGDVRFFDLDECEMAWPSGIADARARESSVRYAIARCPNSKAGDGYDDLYMPAGSLFLQQWTVVGKNGAVSWRVGPSSSAVGACRALWAHFAWFPPTCRTAPFLRQYPSNGQLLVSAFKSWFVRACSHAGIDHSLFGIHCFRVGGMVAMQDGGASLPAVMAQGRWRSDAWTVYCRRRPATAMLWASAIMTAQ